MTAPRMPEFTGTGPQYSGLILAHTRDLLDFAAQAEVPGGERLGLMGQARLRLTRLRLLSAERKHAEMEDLLLEAPGHLVDEGGAPSPINRDAIRVAIRFQTELTGLLSDAGISEAAREIEMMTRELEGLLERRPSETPEMGF